MMLVLGAGAATLTAVGCVGDDAPASVTTDASPSPQAESGSPDVVTPVVDAASDDAKADAPASFNPKQVAGLVLWLDPSVGVTEVSGTVSGWRDSSPSAIDVTQPLAANQPKKLTINGKPLIVGTATSWLEASAASVGTKLDFGLDDVTVEYVVSVELPTTALGGVFYKFEGGAPFNGLQLYGNISGDGKPGAGLDGETLLLKAATGTTGDKPHLVGYRRVGSKLSLRFDGAEVLTATVTPKVVDNAGPLLVGGRPDGVHSTNHLLGDVLIYRGPVSGADLDKIEAYLKTKNGL